MGPHKKLRFSQQYVLLFTGAFLGRAQKATCLETSSRRKSISKYWLTASTCANWEVFHKSTTGTIGDLSVTEIFGPQL